MSSKFSSIICLSLFVFVVSLFSACANETKKTDYIASLPQKQLFVMDTIATLSLDSEYLSACEDVLTGLSAELSMFEGEGIYKLNLSGEAQFSQRAFMLMLTACAVEDSYPSVNIAGGKVTSLWKMSLSEGKIPSDEEISEALKTASYDNIKLDFENLKVELENGAMIDLGSCAKGFALDICKEELEKTACEYGVVTLGSSTLLYGSKPDSKPFSVAVKSPDGEGIALTFETDRSFVSTSGGYERSVEVNGISYDHIIDMSSGKPTQSDLKSVTVIADNGFISDIAATEIYLGGTEDLLYHIVASDYYVIAIDENNKVYASPDVEKSIKIVDKTYKMD